MLSLRLFLILAASILSEQGKIYYILSLTQSQYGSISVRCHTLLHSISINQYYLYIQHLQTTLIKLTGSDYNSALELSVFPFFQCKSSTL